jgi:hypothetical protein
MECGDVAPNHRVRYQYFVKVMIPPFSLISGESLTNQGFVHCTRKTRQHKFTFGLRGFRLLCGLFKGRYIIPTSAWKDWRKSWSQSIQPVIWVRFKLCRLRLHIIKCCQHTKLSSEHNWKTLPISRNSGQPQRDPRTARPIKPQYQNMNGLLSTPRF